LNSKFHFLSTTIRTFYDPRSTHLFIGVQYFSVVSVLQSHVLFTENSVIVITDHHNSSDLHRTDRTTLQRAPFNSMSYICVNTVKIESCVCAATARSLVDYNSCAVGTSDADFFLNNRFLESIQSFTFRIDLAINRNRNNRFLK
jgi:hypothetical protein